MRTGRIRYTRLVNRGEVSNSAFDILASEARKILLLPGLIAGMVSAALVAGIAQLAEQLICNQQVVGSIPTAGSLYNLHKFRNLKLSL